MLLVYIMQKTTITNYEIIIKMKKQFIESAYFLKLVPAR